MRLLFHDCRDHATRFLQLGFVFLTAAVGFAADQPGEIAYRISVTVTSTLPPRKVPLDPYVDFAKRIKAAGLPGVLDPNSIQVIHIGTGRLVPHRLAEAFHYGDAGRVGWLSIGPNETRYEIRFRTAARPQLLEAQAAAPLIGTGDLLLYGAGRPEPIGLPQLSRLVDYTGDGRPDLIGCPVYTYVPHWPGEKSPAGWGGIYCFPGTDTGFEFGRPLRLRYAKGSDDGRFAYFTAGYMHADVADLNADGQLDVVMTAAAKSSEASGIQDVDKSIHVFLNTGKRDARGMPVLVPADRVPLTVTRTPALGADSKNPVSWTSTRNWGPVRAVDLDGNGAIDFVVGSMYRDEAANPDATAWLIPNVNTRRWPFQAADAVKIDVGKRASFYDVDADGRLDSVCLVPVRAGPQHLFQNRVAWRRNLGGNPPRFAPPDLLDDVDVCDAFFTAAVNAGPRRGILVAYRGFQRVAFFHQQVSSNGKPHFERHEAKSVAAPITLGDQATPCICDWDGDGDADLLVGGGHGWVRVLVNHGDRQQPRFDDPRIVMADGKPMRIIMTQIFPGIEGYFHNLGYVHPAYVDWDADGLPDVMLPNLSNRIFWYKNIGTRAEPKFGPRRQVVCDGFPETEDTLRATARLLGSETGNWTKRPADPQSPFWWRSRAGFGDFNGDGLVDLITADGAGTRRPNGFAEQSALFVQYRDRQGNRRLRKDRIIILPDGSPLKNVGGQPAQTIPVDFDGDGLLDLVINHGRTYDSAPALVRNIGTATNPRFDFPVRICCFGDTLDGIAKHGPYYGIGDLDGDRRADLLACTEMGTYLFFRRTAIDMPRRPTFTLSEVRVAEF